MYMTQARELITELLKTLYNCRFAYKVPAVLRPFYEGLMEDQYRIMLFQHCPAQILRKPDNVPWSGITILRTNHTHLL